MTSSSDLTKIDYAQRVQQIVFHGTLHKRVSSPSFPPFRAPYILVGGCLCGHSQLPRYQQQFLCWHSRHWRLYNDGVFVYFESEESNIPLGGVKLGMTDLPLTGEMEETVTQNIYPPRVNERCRLTVPSESRILYLFTESPEDCSRLREQIVRVVRSMKRLHTADMMDMAVESRLYRLTSLGSLGTHLSVSDGDGDDDGNWDGDGDSLIGFYGDCSMERLRREMFNGMGEHVIEEKRRKLCEEIGIRIEDMVTDDEDEAKDERVDSGKKEELVVKKDGLVDRQVAGHGVADGGETASCSGVVLIEEVQQEEPESDLNGQDA